MTNIYNEQLQEIPFFGNERRQKEFAQILLDFDDKHVSADEDVDTKKENNLFEVLTYAMTHCNKESPDLLHNHIDFLNDCTENYNGVFSNYFYSYHPMHPETTVRVVFIGYSRRSIHDYYYNRENNYKTFKDHLLRYYEYLKHIVLQKLTLENAFDWNPTPFSNSTL